MATYQQYLVGIKKPHKNIAKLEFLQPDGTVAFVLDNRKYRRGYNLRNNSSAFIQGGSLTVQLQNGQRRKASITLSNLDKQFSYNVNKIWFGQQIRLSMGIELPNGEDFYLPQGVFYISNPEEVFNPTEKTVTMNLVDKWAYLDGTLMGQLESAYVIPVLAFDGGNIGDSAAISTGAFAYSDGAYHSDWGNYKFSRISITPGRQYSVSCVSSDNSYVEGVLFYSGSYPYTYISYKSRAYNETDTLTFTPPEGCTALGINYRNLSNTAPQVTKLIVRKSKQVNVFDAIRSILTLSRFDRSNDAPKNKQFDSVIPVFSNYWDNRFYTVFNGKQHKATDIPYDITVNSDNGTLADLILELNTVVAGLIGYDETGALRIEPSQDDIEDKDKAILWEFSPDNSIFLGLSESMKNNDVYNDIICVGTGTDGFEVYGRAMNYDPRSDTNIDIIGIRTFVDAQPSYWNAEQCISLASWELKQKTILQKSVSIECMPLFHLRENSLVTVRRTDKEGSPVEKHLIQSYTLPIASDGTMSISCTSVNDFVVAVTASSQLKQTDDPTPIQPTGV